MATASADDDFQVPERPDRTSTVSPPPLAPTRSRMSDLRCLPPPKPPPAAPPPEVSRRAVAIAIAVAGTSLIALALASPSLAIVVLMFGTAVQQPCSA